MIELRVPNASYEKHLAEILAKKLPKITAVFAYENYPIFNVRPDMYNSAGSGSYIAYGIDKKWYGLAFRTDNELEAFKKSRNFIYFLDCKDLNVISRTRNIKKLASEYSVAANQALNYKYGVANDTSIPENKMKGLAENIARVYTLESSKNSTQEAGLFRKKQIENYLQDNGKVKFYADVNIDGFFEVKMPNSVEAKKYFRDNPDKLVELLFQQRDSNTEIKISTLRESSY